MMVSIRELRGLARTLGVLAEVRRRASRVAARGFSDRLSRSACARCLVYGAGRKAYLGNKAGESRTVCSRRKVPNHRKAQGSQPAAVFGEATLGKVKPRSWAARPVLAQCCSNACATEVAAITEAVARELTAGQKFLTSGSSWSRRERCLRSFQRRPQNIRHAVRDSKAGTQAALPQPIQHGSGQRNEAQIGR